MSIQIFDDFLRDPDRVRASALTSGFGTWRPNKGEVGSSVYDGMNFWGDHGVVLRALHAALGRPIYPNSLFFRVTNVTTEGAYVHSDRHSGDMTAIVYLSRHPSGSGTGFYRHRESGMDEMPSLAELLKMPDFFARLKDQMVRGAEEDWELLRFVEGHYNRCLVFDAPLFHARSPKHGFGTSAADGRLVWACHFGVGD